MKKPPRAYTVKLSKEAYEKLTAEADRRGMYLSRLLDNAINSYLDSSKSQAA